MSDLRESWGAPSRQAGTDGGEFVAGRVAQGGLERAEPDGGQFVLDPCLAWLASLIRVYLRSSGRVLRCSTPSRSSLVTMPETVLWASPMLAEVG
jgi:hypothetical protein